MAGRCRRLVPSTGRVERRCWCSAARDRRDLMDELGLGASEPAAPQARRSGLLGMVRPSPWGTAATGRLRHPRQERNRLSSGTDGRAAGAVRVRPTGVPRAVHDDATLREDEDHGSCEPKPSSNTSPSSGWRSATSTTTSCAASRRWLEPEVRILVRHGLRRGGRGGARTARPSPRYEERAATA